MVRLIDYIKKCLKDENFRKVWEEENSDLDPYILGTDSIEDELTIKEALKLLNEVDDTELNSIIKK